MTEVARVAAIWRYPVKSMAAEALEAADVGLAGIAGDRRWAFIRPGLERSDFPWLTIRELPRLRHFVPRLADPDRPDKSPALVRTPDGEELDVADPALAAALGEGVRVIKQNRGTFDWLPLSLISTGTVAALGGLVGRELEVQRFRPNLLIEAEAFAEDGWLGRTLRLGGLQMRVDERDPRCVMVNVDPETDERDHSVLKTIARERQNCAGVYGTPAQSGRVAVGDAVLLED
jgi:uncharacterized protein YcbX